MNRNHDAAATDPTVINMRIDGESKIEYLQREIQHWKSDIAIHEQNIKELRENVERLEIVLHERPWRKKMSRNHDATTADLLRDAYESQVNSHIYCIGISSLLEDEGAKKEFSRIMLKHAEMIGELGKFVKSMEGE